MVFSDLLKTLQLCGFKAKRRNFFALDMIIDPWGQKEHITISDFDLYSRSQYLQKRNIVSLCVCLENYSLNKAWT